MNSFYVFNARRMKRYVFIGIAVLFGIGVVYVEKDNISVFSYSEPSAVYNVITGEKVIALTFDISWGDKRAEPIIDFLKEKEVAGATFFLSSPWSQSHPDIVRKIKEAGFEIGSHGHKHDNYSSLDDEEIRRQIRAAHAILAELTGQSPRLIRMPNGDFDQRVLRIADELGYTVIQWGTDSMDWMNKGADVIAERVVKRAHPGDIVLLHASDSARHTLEALPKIIDRLRAKGYRFVSVSELLTYAKLQGKAVEDQK